MKLRMRRILKEYSVADISFNNIKFKVTTNVVNDAVSIRYIPKNSSESDKLNNTYGTDLVAKKIKEHLQKKLKAQVRFGSREGGLSFLVSFDQIEELILTIIG